MEDLDQAEIGEVAVQGGGGALAGFLDRVDGEFHRDAAGVADALAGAFGEVDVVAVTRGEVAAGLGDADDGLAALELLAGDAVVHVALDVERGHAGVGGVVEPAAAAEHGGGAVGLAVTVVHWFVLPGVSNQAPNLSPGRGSVNVRAWVRAGCPLVSGQTSRGRVMGCKAAPT